VIFHILHMLARIMAPILAFTAEEVWQHVSMKGKDQSVHMSDWPDIKKEMSGWENRDLDAKWDRILDIKDEIMKFLERKREEGLIGSSLEARISMYADDDKMKSFLHGNIGILPLLFRVSQATVTDEPEEGMEDTSGFPLKVKIYRARGEKCPRCWNFSETVGENKEYPELCKRCSEVISERSHDGK
jgi:isoleucyl-tRNA synthetase